MNRKVFQIAGMVLGLLVLGWPALASAESHIEIQLIKATTSDSPSVAGELKELANTLKRFPGFNTFTLAAQDKMSLKLGEVASMAAPGGKKIQVTYRGVSKGFVKLRFKLGELEMNVRVHNGGVFFHGGYKHDGARLIVAVRATSDTLGKSPGKKAPVKR